MTHTLWVLLSVLAIAGGVCVLLSLAALGVTPFSGDLPLYIPAAAAFAIFCLVFGAISVVICALHEVFG